MDMRGVDPVRGLSRGLVLRYLLPLCMVGFAVIITFGYHFDDILRVSKIMGFMDGDIKIPSGESL